MSIKMIYADTINSSDAKVSPPTYEDYACSHGMTSPVTIDSHSNGKLENLLSELSSRVTATQTGKDLSKGTTFYACSLSGPSRIRFGLGVLEAPTEEQLVQWADMRVFSFDRKMNARAIDKITDIIRNAPESTVASWLDQLQQGKMNNRVFTLDLDKPRTSFKSDTVDGYGHDEKGMLMKRDAELAELPVYKSSDRDSCITCLNNYFR